jgi:hypothetical protein
MSQLALDLTWLTFRTLASPRLADVVFCVRMTAFAALAVTHWIEHPNRLEHKEIRPHCTALPHRQDQSRQPDSRRRRPDDLSEALAKIDSRIER